MRWKIYEMRCITTLAKLRGSVVHDILGGSLRGVRHGVNVDLQTAKNGVTEILRAKYQESYMRIWDSFEKRQGRKPSEICNLHEHYYKFNDVAVRTRDARNVAWTCLESAIGSVIWDSIVNSDPKKWMEIDEDDFPNFDLGGIKVYANIDFAHQCDKPTIIDWKTGPKYPSDRKQLAVYSLYAKARWDWEPTETTLVAAYLYPEYQLDAYVPEAGEVEEAADMIKRSFDEMLALEPAFGNADIENYPMTQDKRCCEWCRFRGICGYETGDETPEREN